MIYERALAHNKSYPIETSTGLIYLLYMSAHQGEFIVIIAPIYKQIKRVAKPLTKPVCLTDAS